MIQLELSDDLKNNVRDGNATAWRLESSLREFPNIVPVNFWFEYPIHRIDNSGELDAAYAEGSPMGNLSRSKKYTTAEERRAAIDAAYDVCSIETPVPLEAMASTWASAPAAPETGSRNARTSTSSKAVL